MEAPFDKKLKHFLKSIQDPEKKRAVQLLFLSNRDFSDLSGLSIHRVSDDKEKSKMAS